MLGGLPLDLLAGRRLAPGIAACAPGVVAVRLHPVPDRLGSGQVRRPAGGRVELHEGLPGPGHVARQRRRVGGVHVAGAEQPTRRVGRADAPVMRGIMSLDIQQPVADHLRPGPPGPGPLGQVRVDHERVVVRHRGGEALLSQHPAGEALHQAGGGTGGVPIHHQVQERIGPGHTVVELAGRDRCWLTARHHGRPSRGTARSRPAARGAGDDGQPGRHRHAGQGDPPHFRSPAVGISAPPQSAVPR